MAHYQRITFIIPCRNNVKYLKQAISSIEDCYGDTHNIVILDDASTDGTWEWVQLMEDKHPYIKSYRKIYSTGIIESTKSDGRDQ